jgi:hypothetical protein
MSRYTRRRGGGEVDMSSSTRQVRWQVPPIVDDKDDGQQRKISPIRYPFVQEMLEDIERRLRSARQEDPMLHIGSGKDNGDDNNDNHAGASIVGSICGVDHGRTFGERHKEIMNNFLHVQSLVVTIPNILASDWVFSCVQQN